MSLVIKKVLFVTVLFLLFEWADIQHAYGQSSSLHDSLRYTLNYIEGRTKDKFLRETAKETKALLTGDSINDPVSKKLLIVDSILVNYLEFDQQIVGTYAKALVQLFEDFVPRQEHPYYASSLNNLAVLYMIVGRYEQARPLCEKALAIRKKILGEEHSAYAESLNNQAKLYYYTGQYDKALPLYEQSLAIRKKVFGEGHPEYASGLSDLALLYSYKGQYDTALPLCSQALDIRKKAFGEEHPEYAASLNSLAILYWQMGQYDKALPLYMQALAIRKKSFGTEHYSYAESLNGLAILYMLMGQYDKALPLFQQALAIWKKVFGEEHPDYAYSLNAFAALYYYRGQYDKALPLFQQALAIKKKVFGEEHPEYAGSLNNLALVYTLMGEYEEALPLYQQDIAIYKKVFGEEHFEYASSLNNLADLYKEMRQYDKALALYEQALAIRKKVLGEEHPGYIESLNHLPDLYKEMGQYDKALPLYEQGLAIRKKVLGQEHPDYATSLNDLALLHWQMGHYDKALPLFEQALAIRKRVLGEEHPDYAMSLTGLGLLYSSLGDFTKSSLFFTEACKSTLRHLNQTYVTLSEQEKIESLKVKQSGFDFLPSLLFTQHVTQSSLVNQVFENEIALKGMVLEDQKGVLSSIRNSTDSTALQLYEQWSFDKAVLGKQLILPIDQRLSYLDSLQEVTNQLEQELSRRSTVFRELQLSKAITTKDIAQKLQKNEAALEFIRFNLYNKKWTDSIIYAALILLPGDSIVHFIPLFEERELQHLLKPLSSAKNTVAQYSAIEELYGKNLKTKPGRANASLYELIWEPIEQYLKDVRTVYYAPSGLLHRISFQALRPDSTHLLIDKYELRQVLNTRSVAVPVKMMQKPESVALWGNIDYDRYPSAMAMDDTSGQMLLTGDTSSSFNFYTNDTRAARGGDWHSLPEAKKEIEDLAVLFQHAGIPFIIDSGIVASEETFKTLSVRRPKILHVATHGFFLPEKEKNPDTSNRLNTGDIFSFQQNSMFRSGLILAGGNHAWRGRPVAGREDGILTAYEIAQLDLSGTDMVVLSACETALGDVQGNEGVIGLQRAFKLAGVKQLILSLWQVPDKETTELMILFYQGLIKGQSAWMALRDAQLKMRGENPPYYWAAFVIVE
jgi:tetratricopeptide (TPR) repeat protein